MFVGFQVSVSCGMGEFAIVEFQVSVSCGMGEFTIPVSFYRGEVSSFHVMGSGGVGLFGMVNW